MLRISPAVARALVVCIVVASVPVPPVQAELIATDRIESRIETAAPASARDAVNVLFDRADVRAALESRGVSAADAKARVAALSDDEVGQLAAKFDSLPAGGDGIGGVLWLAFLVFVILLITDILGFTKVFPFTRPAK